MRKFLLSFYNVDALFITLFTGIDLLIFGFLMDYTGHNIPVFFFFINLYLFNLFYFENEKNANGREFIQVNKK